MRQGTKHGMVSIAAAVCLLLVVPAPGVPAQDGSGVTGVDALDVQATGGSIQATGTARFVDIPVQVGSDPAGDADPPVPGSDITTLTMASPNPASQSLLVTMGIADQPPAPVNGAPVFVEYRWLIQAEGSPRYQLRANRLSGGGLPDINPTFEIVRVEPSDGLCGTRVHGGQGRIADGVVEWQVPASQVGAGPGSRLLAVSDITSRPTVGVPGLDLCFGAPFVYDRAQMDRAYVVPGGTVRLGIATAGTPVDVVPLTVTASLDVATGSFQGALPAPGTSGDYVLVARACYGAGNCGTASSTISA